MIARYIEPHERDQLRTALNLIHPRWAIMFDIGLHTGLRVSDICGLRVLQFEHMCNGIGRVYTKKTRRWLEDVSIPRDVSKNAREFIHREMLCKGDKLIYSHRARKWAGVTRQHVERIWRAATAFCGLSSVTPHSLRRTYAIDRYRAGTSLQEVQRLLGHDRLSTTAIYLLER